MLVSFGTALSLEIVLAKWPELSLGYDYPTDSNLSLIGYVWVHR
jgi:hypothetical protein